MSSGDSCAPAGIGARPHGEIGIPQPARRNARYEDLPDLPAYLVGEVYTHPRPAPRHALAYSALRGQICNPYDFGSGAPGRRRILDEPEYHLDGDILAPNLAGSHRERKPTPPHTAWLELAPEWAWEILSRSTARTDRVRKMPIYARAGVGHLWRVDPELQTLVVYQRISHDDTLHWLLPDTLEGDAAPCQPPFDAIKFPLGSLWA